MQTCTMSEQVDINNINVAKIMAERFGRSDYFATYLLTYLLTYFLPSFLPISYNICKKGNDSILSPAWVGGGMLPCCLKVNSL